MVAAKAAVPPEPVVEKVEIEVPATIESPLEDDEGTNLEMQRDLGFKIVFFFAMFVIGTFSSLFAYFKVQEKN
jgi:hypothetical protein